MYAGSALPPARRLHPAAPSRTPAAAVAHRRARRGSWRRGGVTTPSLGTRRAFGMVGAEPNLASLSDVAVGRGGGRWSPSLSCAWHKTQGMGERGYPGKSLGRLPATSRFHFLLVFISMKVKPLWARAPCRTGIIQRFSHAVSNSDPGLHVSVCRREKGALKQNFLALLFESAFLVLKSA